MPKAERPECIEVCEHYGKCFDLATGERDPVAGTLFEAIMHSGDGCRSEGQGDANCAILHAARAVVELCRDSGISPESTALQYYVELFDEGQTSGGDKGG